MNNESYVSVELKGYLDGLRLIIDSDASIAEIESAIKQRLANLGDSLTGTTVRIEQQQNRSLSPEDVSYFYSLMQREYGLAPPHTDEEIVASSQLTSPSAEQPIRGIPANPPNTSIYHESLSEEKEKA